MISPMNNVGWKLACQTGKGAIVTWLRRRLFFHHDAPIMLSFFFWTFGPLEKKPKKNRPIFHSQ